MLLSSLYLNSCQRTHFFKYGYNGYAFTIFFRLAVQYEIGNNLMYEMRQV